MLLLPASRAPDLHLRLCRAGDAAVQRARLAHSGGKTLGQMPLFGEDRLDRDARGPEFHGHFARPASNHRSSHRDRLAVAQQSHLTRNFGSNFRKHLGGRDISDAPFRTIDQHHFLPIGFEGPASRWGIWNSVGATVERERHAARGESAGRGGLLSDARAAPMQHGMVAAGDAGCQRWPILTRCPTTVTCWTPFARFSRAHSACPPSCGRGLCPGCPTHRRRERACPVGVPGSPRPRPPD